MCYILQLQSESEFHRTALEGSVPAFGCEGGVVPAPLSRAHRSDPVAAGASATSGLLDSLAAPSERTSGRVLGSSHHIVRQLRFEQV
eukprot:CAMPEP_0195622936 /NCGR_PEP_ID=MMETSP0815-20121206/16480_1 /TAXON_ID=97485 /ORGANISM="Prymnesium parvum, Strain Texoma1" /LENGTH=86 /DNA_ID=CAMNT_0040763769 /DNA_START=219 /DNA_END=480 /DNA_ORIENTATION=+